MTDYHVPVLLGAALEGLAIRPSGIYIDATFGGGGHAKEITHRLDDNGHLFVFDQDEAAAANLWGDDRITLIRANFRHMVRWMEYYGVSGKVDGLLADLGVSSHQFDQPERGFSYRFDEPLDMRMNRQQATTAADVLRTYDAARLQDIFSRYGELPNARTLAQRIVQVRTASPVATTGQLVALAEPLARGQRMRYLAQLFQALRIEVNDEMGALQELLEGAQQVLKPGGRLAIIAYHSLEDRMVKRLLKTGNVRGEPEKDFYGRVRQSWQVITPHPVEPGDEELERNPRARSAKLRVGEKKHSA
jgi:16S rRNA (cytosine1402-N4)-methyltransferase